MPGTPLARRSNRTRLPRGTTHVALVLLTASLLAGCASIVRLDPPPSVLTTDLPVLGLSNARFWPDGPPDALSREGLLMVERGRAAQRVAPEAHFLALSGGGDNGAFGAGLMNGWTEAGNRPEFTVVTGISAGALIAPFAFLGPAYDAQLREVFTPAGQADVLRFGGWLSTAFSLIFGEAVADTSPLYRMIERYADETMLRSIAREYERGRLLLIGTTNLDLQRPVVWNIGAIAASGQPGALDLFRRILLASASIPGAFPPVLVNIEHQGRPYQEMHVDGGASVQVFFYPPSMQLRELDRARSASPRRVIHVVRNGRIDLEGATVARGVMSITGRSASTLLHFSGINDINRIYLTAVRDGLGFRVAYIGTDFRAPRSGAFDPDFMKALFEYGRVTGRNGTAWETAPPFVTTSPAALPPDPASLAAGR
ncbi:patatin-like phospholipase family protein [Falsiroseomonas sp. E2-1-a20]|uniref:patatin-like phospholipase family protein n=1 Tax=Falsiroseomonas sp. E2-1-a20 TaxID=3239300 RepID=UPI003F2DF7B3